MRRDRLNIVVCGLSLTSSWGNGHATTYRALLKAFAALGHRILFLERDVPWYRENRDLTRPSYCKLGLYQSVEELQDTYEHEIARADAVIVGSYVPDGVIVGDWIIDVARGPVCFYDIDTPVTLSKLRSDDNEYLSRELVARYDCYLSFTGGPTLRYIERSLGSRCARALYCAVDESVYCPQPRHAKRWELGYLGTYSRDRQPSINQLLVKAARRRPNKRFAVAGSLYPETIRWPDNVDLLGHLAPSEHRCFYNSQEFTLNVTRADMIAAGYSPSVRLFEAAACGIPVISDYWKGLDSFFRIGEEILIVDSASKCLSVLASLTEEQRR